MKDIPNIQDNDSFCGRAGCGVNATALATFYCLIFMSVHSVYYIILICKFLSYYYLF